SFCRQPLSPMFRRQTPTDFHARRVMRFKLRNLQANEPYERATSPKLRCPKAESMLVEMSLIPSSMASLSSCATGPRRNSITRASAFIRANGSLSESRQEHRVRRSVEKCGIREIGKHTLRTLG